MNNTVRLFAAAAAVVVVALIGYQLLIAPNVAGPGPTPSPTAAPTVPSGTGPTASVTPALAEFTACLPGNVPINDGTHEQQTITGLNGDVTLERTRDATYRGTITATDPRFTGNHYYSWNANNYLLGSAEEGQGSWVEGHRIENDQGAWQGWATGAGLPDGTQAGGPIVLSGEGAYEGITAVLFMVDGSCFFDFRGVVMDVPEPSEVYTGE